MINYSSLPFMHFNQSTRNVSMDEILLGISKLNLDFLLSDLTNLLHGDYNMAYSSDALMNIMGNPSTAGNLFYCQFFSINDASPEYYTDRENADSYEIRFTLSGSGTLEYRGRKYILHKGEGFFISSREHHFYKANADGWKCTIFHLNGALCQQYFDTFTTLNGSVKFTEKQFPAFESLQFQVLQATQKMCSYMMYRVSCLIDLMLTELLASCTSSQKSSAEINETVSSIIEYLHTHFHEKIVFEDLAKVFHLSRTSLFSTFKQYTGYTPGDYLMDLRIRQAKLLLRTSDMSVENVSCACGFSDTGHFGQIFKKKVGLTPLKYRKM